MEAVILDSETELSALEARPDSDLRAEYTPGQWIEAWGVFRARCDARAHLLGGRGAGAGLWRDRTRARALAARWIDLARRADPWVTL